MLGKFDMAHLYFLSNSIEGMLCCKSIRKLDMDFMFINTKTKNHPSSLIYGNDVILSVF